MSFVVVCWLLFVLYVCSMLDDRWLLIYVRCLLFVVRCSLSADCFYVVCWLLFVVRCLLLFVVRCLLWSVCNVCAVVAVCC